MIKHALFLGLVLLVPSWLVPVHAHEYKVGELHIGHPYARSTPPGAKAGGAYLSIDNKGKAADKLLRASSPRAGSVELHTMSMEGNIMRMRQVPAIEVAPGTVVKLAPGGLHVMLQDLKQSLSKGDRFPMTLVFERAGEVKVDIVVEDAPANAAHGAAAPAEAHKH